MDQDSKRWKEGLNQIAHEIQVSLSHYMSSKRDSTEVSIH